MKQIKTIYEKGAKTFDTRVNEALAEGWVLAHRGYDAFGFIAELERYIKKNCDNCKHNDTEFNEEPCSKCNADFHKWEAPDK